jgi:hypothetical protein
VLRAALDVASRAPAWHGDPVALPVAAIPHDVRADPPVPPPIVQLVKRKPWLAVKLLARDIPEPRQPGAA